MIAGLARAAFGLVGDQHHRHVLLAQPAGDHFVERGHAGARVEHEQGDLGAFDRNLGLRAHPARQAVGVLVFPAGGVDHREVEPEQVRLAETAVARDAGLVVDQRQFLADQPVEQGRFAHIGAPDNDDLREHYARASGRGCGERQGFPRVARQAPAGSCLPDRQILAAPFTISRKGKLTFVRQKGPHVGTILPTLIAGAALALTATPSLAVDGDRFGTAGRTVRGRFRCPTCNACPMRGRSRASRSTAMPGPGGARPKGATSAVTGPRSAR